MIRGHDQSQEGRAKGKKEFFRRELDIMLREIAPLGLYDTAYSTTSSRPPGLSSAAHLPQHADLILVKMQRIRHQQPIQRRQIQRAGEVGRQHVQVGRIPKAHAPGPFQLAQPGLIPVDRVDAGLLRRSVRAAPG